MAIDGAVAPGQQEQAGKTAADRVELGRLANGATVAFVRAGSGDWGIEISGGTAPRLTQPKPAQIEVFAGGENVTSACRRLPIREERRRRGCGDGEGDGRRPGGVCRRGPVEGLGRRVVAQPESERDRRGAQRRVLLGDPALDRAHGQMGGRRIVSFRACSTAIRRTPAARAQQRSNYRAKRFHDTRGLSVRAAVRRFVPGWELGGGAGPGAARRHHPGGDHGARRPRRSSTSAFSSGPWGERSCRRRIELGFWLPGTTTESGGRVVGEAQRAEPRRPPVCGAAIIR